MAWGQIETTIGDFETEIRFASGKASRYFVGEFQLQNLPKPLEPCKVNFNLEVAKERPEISDSVWEIRLLYMGDEVAVVGDTAWHWSGPHKIGSRFSGTLEFVPLRSGKSSITLYYRDPRWNDYFTKLELGLGIYWCLGPDGELRYLGKDGRMPDGCLTVRNTFFKGDSITIYDNGDYTSDDLFEYRILVEPQPRIGDTCNIHFFLKARYDALQGCDLRADVGSMEIISKPNKINFQIRKGQTIENNFRVVNLPLRNGHGITFGALCGPTSRGEHKYSATIRCSFIFYNDSALRYVNYEDYNYERAHIEETNKTLFPNIFPWATSGDIKRINVAGDSIEIF